MTRRSTTASGVIVLLLTLVTSSHGTSENETRSTTLPTLHPSPPLTPSELATLETISDLPYHAPPSSSSSSSSYDPHGLLEPIRSKITTVRRELSSLSAYSDETLSKTLSETRFAELSLRAEKLRRRTEALVGFEASVSDGRVGIGGYNVGRLKEVERRLERWMGLVEDQKGELETAVHYLVGKVGDDNDDDYDYNFDEFIEETVDNLPSSCDDNDDGDEKEDDRDDDDNDKVESTPPLPKTTSKSSSSSSLESSSPITYEEMKNSLRWHHLLPPLEAKAQTLLLKHLHDRRTKYATEEADEYRRTARELERKTRRVLDGVETVGKCVEKKEAGAAVLEALRTEEEELETRGRGRGATTDRLQGAKVVYGDAWTSDTFHPSSLHEEPSPRRNHRSEWTLRGSGYADYLPEDWSGLLPRDWDTYDFSRLLDYVPASPAEAVKRLRSFVPPYVWHSLPPFLGRSSSSAAGAGVLGGVAPPPETAIDANTNLGSCWPIKHHSDGVDGVLTLRLETPLESVEGLTIEHAGGTSSRADKTSAPRNVRLVGYPVCDRRREESDGNGECHRMGFDAESPVRLGSFQYRAVPRPEGHEGEPVEEERPWPTRSVQTFRTGSSGSTTVSGPIRSRLMEGRDDLAPTTPEDTEDTEEEEEEGVTSVGGFGAPADAVAPGSCSISSCTAPPPDEDDDEDDDTDHTDDRSKKRAIAAVQIQIVDNWGNPDFTCLYRVRLHGRAATSGSD